MGTAWMILIGKQEKGRVNELDIKTMMIIARTKVHLLEMANNLLDESVEIDRKNMAAKILAYYAAFNIAAEECDSQLFSDVITPLNMECARNESRRND